MLNVANSRMGVVVFSLEMPKEQLVNRMISCNCRFDLKKLRNPSEITSEE
jgi:replicative DNA helicase